MFKPLPWTKHSYTPTPTFHFLTNELSQTSSASHHATDPTRFAECYTVLETLLLLPQFTHSPHSLISTLLCRQPVWEQFLTLSPVNHTMLSSTLEAQSLGFLTYKMDLTPYFKCVGKI